MGLGQTNVGLLLRSWEAGGPGLSSESWCFGKSKAGCGLSLTLGITVGEQHCPGDLLLVHLCPARQHPLLRPRLLHSPRSIPCQENAFPSSALYYVELNIKQGWGEGCSRPKLQAPISEHNGEKEKSNDVLKFNLENIFAKPLREAERSAPLLAAPAAAAQLEAPCAATGPPRRCRHGNFFVFSQKNLLLH